MKVPIALALVALAIGTIAVDATGRRSHRCPPVESGSYQSRYGIEFARFKDRKDAYNHFGCLYGVGKSYVLDHLWNTELASASFSTRGGNPEIVGRYIAHYMIKRADPSQEPGTIAIRVFDLREGKEVFSEDLYEETKERARVGPIILKPNGSVVWTLKRRTGTEVDVHDSKGRRTLDVSPEVVYESVALSGDGKRLFWLHGNEAREAPID